MLLLLLLERRRGGDGVERHGLRGGREGGREVAKLTTEKEGKARDELSWRFSSKIR